MLRQKYASEGMQPIIRYESRTHNHNVKKLDGTMTSASKCCGYCMNCIHEGYIDEKILKKHDCLNKKCNYYYERIKETNIAQFTSRIESERKKENILRTVNKYLNSSEGIKATGITDKGDYYEIRYAQICNCDEIIESTQVELINTIGIVVSFVNINADFETQLQLVFG